MPMLRIEHMRKSHDLPVHIHVHIHVYLLDNVLVDGDLHLTSGMTYCPASINAPRRLSLPSFLTSDIGTCMRKKTVLKNGEGGRKREGERYKERKESTKDALYATAIIHSSEDII